MIDQNWKKRLLFSKPLSMMLFLALIILGFIGSYCSCELLYSLAFIFGSIFSLLALQLFAFRYGITIPHLYPSASDIRRRKQNEELAEQLKAEKLRMADIEREQRHLREKEMLVKDLHDGIGGIISNIAMLAQYGNLSASEHERRNVMAQIAELASEGTTEVRSFMNSLEGGEATWNNLLAEIRSHCGKMLGPHGIDFKFTSELDEKSVNPGIFCYVNMIRIFRELIANIVKHARATHVSVTLAVKENNLLLEIRDNGIGFDSAFINRRGISNITSRARAMGASFDLISDNGTCARFRLNCDTSMNKENQ